MQSDLEPWKYTGCCLALSHDQEYLHPQCLFKLMEIRIHCTYPDCHSGLPLACGATVRQMLMLALVLVLWGYHWHSDPLRLFG